MNVQDHHSNRNVMAGYATRALDSDFPELRTYLRPGAHVLDVGCGPATITLDVAAVVNPACVVGLDISDAAVASAKERATEAAIPNVDFVVGDACSLPFEDERFDIVYSHALFSWLRDPVHALSEQRRVIRPGGRVIHPVGDLGTRTMYPACPNLEKVFESWRLWSDRGSDSFVQDNWAARHMVEYLRQAGFREIQTRPKLEVFRSLGGLSTFLLNATGTLQEPYRDLFRRGALAESTLETAREEISVWHSDPSRYYFQTTIIFVAQP